MKLVDNKVEEYIQKPGIEGVYEAIASAARICYQTDEEKMKLSPREFVNSVLLKNGHTRPFAQRKRQGSGGGFAFAPARRPCQKTSCPAP
jgi:hypothetical protein